MNCLLVFILNVLGWDVSNIDQYLKKIDNNIVLLSWSVDVSFVVVLNILLIFIVLIVDKKVVSVNVKDDDYGNVWLKMYLVGSGLFKMCVY